MDFSQRKRALVIVNPKAGKIKLIPQILDMTRFGINNIEPAIYSTTARGDATRFVKEMGDDFDMVICRGGDGTLNEVINGVMQLETKRPIGYIPSGTTNDLAKTLNIPSNTKKAMDIIINGEPSPHDIGNFNSERYFSYIASFGAFTSASYSTPQSIKNSIGHVAYLMEATKAIKDIHPIAVKMKADGVDYEGKVIFGSVSNSLSAAGVITFDKSIVNLSDGKFEVIMVQNPGSVAKWKEAIKAILSKDYDSCDKIFFCQASHIELTFEEDVPWTLDGEYAGSPRELIIDNVFHGIDIYR